MARGLQKLNFFGFMDRDTDPTLIKPENYTDAKNISFLTTNTESSGSHVPMLGNIPAPDLGSISAQNKTWRLFTANVNDNATLNFTNANGIPFQNVLLVNANPITTVVFPIILGRNQSIVFQRNQLFASLNKALISPNFATVTQVTTDATVGAEMGYIDITINYNAGLDWQLSATNGVGATLQTEIVNEAFDTSLSGELHPIGSYDLLGDLYVWSTSQKNLPSSYNISITAVGAYFTAYATNTIFIDPAGVGLYKLTTLTPHNLTQGQQFSISGTGTLLDGIWIADVINATNIGLISYFANFTVIVGLPKTATFYINTNGVGEIGVGQYAASTDTWLYTRLGRTKQWGFRTKKQPDTYCEQTSLKSSIYWTDDFNVPRCIYYIFVYDANGNKLPFFRDHPFFGDGIISTINSSGLYSYSTINIESKLQLSDTGVKIEFLQQLQTGGQLSNGNWRYAVRLLTEQLTATQASDTTNPINVYSAATNGAASLIHGDAPDTITPKINQLKVTGITPGLFKYAEIIGVNYIGDAVVGYLITRILLSTTQTSIIFNHIGTENNTSDFDLGLLNQVFALIETAKNIDVIDKRMILSNLTTQQRIDFSAWAQTFTHSLIRTSIPTVGDAISGQLRLGEYQDPINVNGFVGYMHDETYRFGVKVRFKKGGWSDVYWVDDIKFDTVGAGGRRIAGLPDFDLTDFNAFPTIAQNVFIASIQFNFNLDFLVERIKVRDLIDAISFERAECVKEVLACGIGVLGIAGLFQGTGLKRYSTLAVTDIGENALTRDDGAGGLIAYPTMATGGAKRNYISFYSPDIQFNNTSINFNSSQQLLNHGAQKAWALSTQQTLGATDVSAFVRWAGITGATSATINILSLTDGKVMLQGTSTNFGADIYHKQLTQPGTQTWNNSTSMVLKASSNAINVSANGDYGFYYMQYFQALTDKYGEKKLTTYISTGNMFDINSLTPTNSSSTVFGGDTFTQLNYFRTRIASVAPPVLGSGYGEAISFYSQNRINAQMKNPLIAGTLVYPGFPTDTWLQATNNDTEIYNNGYTIRNEVQSDIAFDTKQTDDSDQPARIRWSAIKPQGSLSDQYRTYLFLDSHDLDQSNGEIVHHANGNGELLTWQQRAFMRQYFNLRGALEVKGITEILIGDGGVMSRDGVTVSRLGSKHKWAIIKGKSVGGNDVFYWLNTELKKALRFGYDGTVSIADIKGMQSFFANNLTWVDGKDTPADGTGICGVWDDRYANAIWTARGIKAFNVAAGLPIFTTWLTASSYPDIASYPLGVRVVFSTDPFNTFGDIYENILVGQANIGNQPDLFPLKWKKLPNDGTYFNQYTLMFNEFKNGFICDATFTPKIYLKHTDTFLSPRPISPESKIYQHNKGRHLWWYENAGVKQTERAYIEGIVNQYPEETKSYEAIGIDSDITPIRLEFKTKQHESFLTQSEFTSRTDSFVSPIKKDSTTSGINSSNTSTLFGKYLKAKMFFEVDIYNKLSNFIVKFRLNARLKSK